MLESLFRPFTGSKRANIRGALPLPDERDLHVSPGNTTRQEYAQYRHATADFTEADDDDDDEDEDDDDDDEQEHRQRRTRRDEEDDDDDEDDQDEDGLQPSNSVLPLFSASHLDSLPIYSITHAIRIIVQTRTETTLTWDQLRSPQVSQFLVKPMQQQIRTQHFSRATLYALMANCLQFAKEGQMNPGNAGACSTRSKICELLAIKLLKEYTTRELIDALSYDFYPLQGIPGSQTLATPGGKPKPAALRTSTLEVAIRASAKHLLAHPLVVQHLEAIWNGAISFYSAADQLHRGRLDSAPSVVPSRRQSDSRIPLLGNQGPKEEHIRFQLPLPGRRTVSLYDPRNASLFKLSRLRVPRYRQFLSTCSLGVLICLFLAVLVQRSKTITSLELFFWFWSTGFMLDELVGFNEQGFSLYIMSFWNIFDLGILLLLIVYYCMRIYGVFLLDPHRWNENAYDVLAANAILLMPRVFSILDHYQYFSQLLIAFRLMAVDLAAVIVLVLISCSGFFVFFTLSVAQNDPQEVAYKIFQILMGFTPAAWEVWPEYNWLGRLLMGFFLVICHFVVVTILITVLTNSFMSIASNANQEHQFLFAINTISMVKNDALFSYIAPSNIFAWVLMPVRYCLPMQQFVWLNRFVIKVTHFPLLFCIYLYERWVLAPSMYEPTDLVAHRGWHRQRSISIADPTTRSALFSPNVRVREESVVGYQKDRALEEVFRRAPDFATMRTQRRNERRNTQNAIRSWMDQTNTPNYATFDSRTGSEWARRLSLRDLPKRFRQVSEVKSVASDPADMFSNAPRSLAPDLVDPFTRRERPGGPKYNTDDDGDDELVTNDEDEEDNATNTIDGRSSHQAAVQEEDYFTTPTATRFTNPDLTTSSRAGPLTAPPKAPWSPPMVLPARRNPMHNRTLSTNTILYAPQDNGRPHSASSAAGGLSQPRSRPLSGRGTPAATPGAGRRSPRRSVYVASRPRPILPPRDMARTAPNRSSLQSIEIPSRKTMGMRQLSIDMDASSELNAAMAVDDTLGAVPSSFATQMAMATGLMTPKNHDSNRMTRLMLAKMKTLEESLGEVVREMRVLRSTGPSTAYNSGEEAGAKGKGPRKHGNGPGSFAGSTESAGPPVVEVARGDRPTSRRQLTARSRPVSRRHMTEGASGTDVSGDLKVLPARPSTKGKGKAPLRSAKTSQDEGESSSDDMRMAFVGKQGSSF